MDQTLRSKTLRPAENGGGGATIRTAAVPQNALGTTQRSTSDVEKTDLNADVFVLKGRQYTNIRCLSDNSGEAQVYLVERGGREFVLKIYYPNFVVKRTLLRIIRNMEMEMIMKLMDFGKTYVEGKNRD